MNKTNIVQFWHSPGIPVDVQALISSWSQLNPGSNHLIFDQRAAIEFMQLNFSADIVEAFRQITLPAMLCDVFRVAYLLKEGGLYVDCSAQCLQPIKDWDISSSNVTLMRKWHGAVCNGIIAAPAGHPWLHEVWARMERVLMDKQDGNIWSLTGPQLFTEIATKEAALAADDTSYRLPGDLQDQRSMLVIDQADFSDRFTLVGTLKHKSRSHWSKLQGVIPLFSARYASQGVGSVQTAKLDKHLIVQIAVCHAGFSDFEERCANLVREPDTELFEFIVSDDPTQTSESDTSNEKLVVETILEAATATTANRIVVKVDMTQSVSEENFNKKTWTKTLENLGLLCDCFVSSEVIYSTFEQSSAIAALLKTLPEQTALARESKIDVLLKNPVLDFNLVDEALRFFFPESTLTPMWADIPSFSSELQATQIDQISQSFAVANNEFFEKYPGVLSVARQLDIKTA